MKHCILAALQGDITDEEFRAHFAQFGEMDDCVVRILGPMRSSS